MSLELPFSMICRPSKTSPLTCRPCIIASGKGSIRFFLHAAGRDFHVFNTLFRYNEKAEVRKSRMDLHLRVVEQYGVTPV